MPYQRQFPSEVRTDTWTTISEDELRDCLDGWYNDVQVVIDGLRDGEHFRTPFAFYRFTESEER